MRNRIRNELLPLLREDYQPGLDKTVLRLMDIVGAEAEFVSEAAKIFCAGLNRPAPAEAPGRTTLLDAGPAVLAFDELAVAVQRKALQQQLTGLG